MLAKPGPTPPVLRSGAQQGDVVMVTGSLGGSGAGKHLSFTPRVAEALQLARMVDIHAMIDISDGLASDLGHICRQSNVDAVIEASAVPISQSARSCSDPLLCALADGEDFELLFCVSSSAAELLQRQWQSGLQISRIGRIVAPKDPQTGRRERVYLQNPDGSQELLSVKGWEHFRERSVSQNDQ